MQTITNFTPQANYYRLTNRTNVERHFKVRNELLAQAEAESNITKKTYYFGQAALRDTKARELWDAIIVHAETLGTLVSDNTVIIYKALNYPNLGKTPKLSWWKMWLTNFA